MEIWLVDYFVVEFKEKSGIDVFNYLKGMVKLKK